MEDQKVVNREESGTLSKSVSVIVIVLACSLVSVLLLTFIQWRRNKNLNKKTWRIDIQDITYAKVENKAGYFVLPNISTIQESIDFYLNTTTSLVFPLIDSPAPMSYPISLFTYFIFHSDNVDNCYSMAEFVSYIRWIYNNEDAVKMCSTSGFVPLSERLIRDVETKIIKDLTCGGHTIVKLLEDQKVVNREESGKIIKISICDSHRLSMLTCVCFTIDFYSMAEK